MTPPAWNEAPIPRIETKWAPILMLIVPPLCWAGNVVLARSVIHSIPPIGLAFWRWTVAFGLMIPFAFRHIVKDLPLIQRNRRMLLVLSAFGIAAFNTLLYLAVHTTSAINCALIQTTMPAFILIITFVGFREKTGWLQTVGVILCMFGAAVVVLRGDLKVLLGMSFSRGDLLMLVAVVCYGVYTVLLPKRPPIHPMTFLTVTFGIGASMLLPIYLWEHWTIQPMVWSLPTLNAVLYVSVFPSIVAYFCWNRGTELIGANRSGLFINLVPIFAAVLSMLWLNEPPMPYHLIGMGLVFSGMMMVNLRPNGNRK
ncbi:MAG: DMT family transporter [Thermodesulfobacteriota bacterium]